MLSPAARPLALAVAVLLGAGCHRGAPVPSPDPASRRQLPAGAVVGFAGAEGSHAWRGIPYARPPVGALRWRAPRPAEVWGDTRAALTPGAICPQLASELGGDETARAGTPVGNEDCLTLDVWAPRMDAAAAAAARLPVMVWIHGGGNVVGSTRRYDGGRLAAQNGVVVVAIQYRLGPLGWFRHAALRAGAETPEDRSGNFGTLDQIRALSWVRENISAFGGDPSRVTIFGESAGGRDVVALLISPRARGLFQRAIVQSGGVGTTPVHEAENFSDDPPPGAVNSSNEVLLRLLESDGARNRAAARAKLATMSADQIASYLRGKDSDEILGAYELDRLESLPDVPQVFRDGTVIPLADALDVLAATPAAARVPAIFGSNRDEFRLFLSLRPDYAHWVLGIIPRIADVPVYLATAEHVSDLWKATAVDEPAAALSRARAPVWAYRFDWDEEPELLHLADLSVLLGAAHGFEIPFVFGHWDLGRRARVLFTSSNEPGREALAAQMMSYWAQFAYAGDPGSGRNGELPQWQPWGTGDRLVLDTPAGGGARMESGSVGRNEVIAAVESDPRLSTPRAKCGAYRELAAFDRGFSPEEYARVGSGACAGFPYESYPWK